MLFNNKHLFLEPKFTIQSESKKKANKEQAENNWRCAKWVWQNELDCEYERMRGKRSVLDKMLSQLINQLLVTGNTHCWIKVQGRQKPGFDLVCSYAKTEGKIKPTAKGTKCVIVKIFHIFNTLKYPVNCVNIFYNCITFKDKLVEYNKMLRSFSERVVGIEKWKVVHGHLFSLYNKQNWRQEYFVK